MTNKTQLRGICQCCGREQAVVRGLMSKHGYTVENHWFNGICSGERFAPMQKERAQADAIVVAVRKQCDELEALAAAYESGEKVPDTVRKACTRRDEEPTMPWAEALPHQQREEVARRVWNNRQRARAGRDFASMLSASADKFHGTALREVERTEGPAPIRIGERRELNTAAIPKHIAVVTRVDRHRVYWKVEGFRSGWTGTRAWRALPTA